MVNQTITAKASYQKANKIRSYGVIFHAVGISGLYAEQVLADRAYDADKLHDLILDQGGEPVIPPRRHRKFQHDYDHIAYKQRWGIEGFFAKLKQWRRIATRYDKLAANFLGFVKLAAIMLWLK